MFNNRILNFRTTRIIVRHRWATRRTWIASEWKQSGLRAFAQPPVNRRHHRLLLQLSVSEESPILLIHLRVRMRSKHRKRPRRTLLLAVVPAAHIRWQVRQHSPRSGPQALPRCTVQILGIRRNSSIQMPRRSPRPDPAQDDVQPATAFHYRQERWAHLCSHTCTGLSQLACWRSRHLTLQWVR